MKLLIVDDEKLTREGLSETINWKRLGINYVYEADDGLNGLDLAKKYKPDIILTDVRMPRMDGIELAGRIRKLLPSSSLIFMSAYSDKEYLKAAIKLNAINYIEKPINPNEVRDAIAIATKNINQNQLIQQTEDIRKEEAVSKLVLDFNYLNSESSYVKLQNNINALGFNVKHTTHFNTVIIKTIESDDLLNSLNLNSIKNYIAGYLNDNLKDDVNYIHGIKQNEFIIFHLFYNINTSSSYIKSIFDKLSNELLSICNFFICIGNRVTGISNVFKSYNTAVITLQNAFFQDINRVLVYNNNGGHHNKTAEIPNDFINTFELHLKNKDEEGTMVFLDNLYTKLKGNLNIISHTVKEFYYRLFIKLEETQIFFHINNLPNEKQTILNTVMNCHTLVELHALLENAVRNFIIKHNEVSEENIHIVYTKEYISQNYMDNNLSIKSISDFIRLSPSYICTVFKNETDQTLNQYITQYRINKAMELLMDPRNKVSDISLEVGYTDSNYFSKSFKKIVGQSPTEFRERHIS